MAVVPSLVVLKKLSICPNAMMTAIPVVNPVITGTGIKEVSFPRRRIPASNNIIPASSVAINTPSNPYPATNEVKMAAIAPVGPEI